MANESSEDFQPVPINETKYEASFMFDPPEDIFYVVWSFIRTAEPKSVNLHTWLP